MRRRGGIIGAVITLRTWLLVAALVLSGCLTWVEPRPDDDDSAADDDDTSGDDDTSDDDDDETTAPTDADDDGFTTEQGDCDDSNSDVHPDAEEVCNGIDDNCDGDEDEGLASTQYAPDADGDGYGSGNEALQIQACAAPDGYVQTGSGTVDCADADPAIHPGATEVCNGLDDDCDGAQDEQVLVPLFVDMDQDGWGAGSQAGMGCPGAGYSLITGDCDDYNAELNQDDVDLDGVTSCDGDCEDGNSNIQPGSDWDGDGYTGCGSDCDDADSQVNPQAGEVCNQQDDDCNGVIDDWLNSLVVIHGADLASADAISTMAANRGWCVGPPIDVLNLYAVSALPYRGVIITADAGDSTGPFGDINPLWGWFWSGSGGTTGLPGALIAMGSGGLSVLDWIGQNPDFVWTNTGVWQGTNYVVRTPSNQVFTYPNPINPAAGSVLTITSQVGAQNLILLSDSNCTGLAWGNQVLGSTSLAKAPTSAGSGARDLWFWGSDAPVGQATNMGLQLLENVIQAAIGPP